MRWVSAMTRDIEPDMPMAVAMGSAVANDEEVKSR
jgi:hypothetical protein